MYFSDNHSTFSQISLFFHVAGQAGRDGSPPTDVIKNQDFTKFPIVSLELIMNVAEDMLGRGMAEEANDIIGFLKLASKGSDPQKQQIMKGDDMS